MNESTIVEEDGLIEPENDEVDYLLDQFIEDCRNNTFQTFEYRCVYDIKLRNLKNIEEVILTINHECMKLKSEYYRLNKKIKNARNNGFSIDEIVKMTKNTDSSLSNISICYFLKFWKPIMHSQFFRIIFQNPEYVKSVCIDRKKTLFILHVVDGFIIINQIKNVYENYCVS